MIRDVDRRTAFLLSGALLFFVSVIVIFYLISHLTQKEMSAKSIEERISQLRSRSIDINRVSKDIGVELQQAQVLGLEIFDNSDKAVAGVRQRLEDLVRSVGAKLQSLEVKHTGQGQSPPTVMATVTMTAPGDVAVALLLAIEEHRSFVIEKFDIRRINPNLAAGPPNQSVTATISLGASYIQQPAIRPPK